MGDSEKKQVLFARWIMSPAAGYCRQNPDGSRYDWAAYERKQGPVAWRVYDTDGSESVYSLYEQARTAADEMNWSVEPLYRQQSLTDAERVAIDAAVRITDSYDDEMDGFPSGVAATLRGLLERTK
jgi:hypothetical protein